MPDSPFRPLNPVTELLLNDANALMEKVYCRARMFAVAFERWHDSSYVLDPITVGKQLQEAVNQWMEAEGRSLAAFAHEADEED